MTYMERLSKNQQTSAGTSDPEPEPRQHYEIHCGKCNWWGMNEQLKTVYVAVHRDVAKELGCPMCESDQWLEEVDNEQ